MDKFEKVKDLYKQLNNSLSDLVIGRGEKGKNIQEIKKVSGKLANAIQVLEVEDIKYERK
jgi:hypothetical protein